MAYSRSKYRKDATDGYFYSDLVEYGYDDNKEKLVPQSIVESVINDIEYDVDEIETLLDNISGLTEVDEIKDKVKELAEKLY